MADELLATATWQGAYASTVAVRHHEIAIDEPESAGGGDSGMMPTEALIAALASCFCLAVAHVARRDGVLLERLEVDVRAERAGRELRYGRMVVTARAPVDDDALAQLVTRARRVCWVSNTLADPPEVEYRSLMEVP
jgi:putative redox protein